MCCNTNHGQVCQNEKDGDMECQKKEMQLADDEDFGSHCLGKLSSLYLN